MAKRKRLTPASPDFLGGSPAPTASPEASPTPVPAPSAGPSPARPALSAASTPPIAQVAGGAARNAAFEEVTALITEARREGRLIQPLPLSEIDPGYLVRDRISVPEEDQQSLRESLRARGQQMAIEVVDLGEGREPRYGLISGWRRLSSLRALFEETGEARFSTVLARIRPPQAAGEAYVSMVEENEIRLGLSYYERARIATKAVEAGAFEHDEAALSALYASASRPRRSKIRSFAELVRRLDALLRFPASLGERIGLEMAKALREDPGFETRLAAALDKAAPESAEAEQEAIRKALKTPAVSRAKRPEAPKQGRISGPVELHWQEDRGEIVLSGAGVTEELRQRLEAWLAGK
ncbi:nuclease [Salipiger thiooxidans]|uniref:ParB/RepB/Spo0J family partition protein n=1 Tax=Salipiger thiooxidans TaxID=282683 RepID=UPI001A8E3EC0|nr:nuclease [Salipiger thiooxidans]MBN8189850.1 nuclease [Salipiger thiooxidans]